MITNGLFMCKVLDEIEPREIEKSVGWNISKVSLALSELQILSYVAVAEALICCWWTYVCNFDKAAADLKTRLLASHASIYSIV